MLGSWTRAARPGTGCAHLEPKLNLNINPNPKSEVCCACLISMVRAGQVDPRGKTWNRLRASIGQPNFIDVEAEETPEEQADTVKEEESIKVPQMS